MLRTLRRLLFGRLTFTAAVVFVLAAAWLVWWSVPQGPAEILTMEDPRAAESDFGPSIPYAEGMLCGTGVDWSKVIRAPDRSWTVYQEADNSLSIAEPGTRRLDRKMPPADYRWVAGSQVGGRLAAQVDNHYHVWDIENGQLLGRWQAPAQWYQLSPSGKHIFTQRQFHADIQDEWPYEVIEVDGGRLAVHFKRDERMNPFDGPDPPKLRYVGGTVFSPDGRWTLILAQDIQWRSWIWLWNLTAGRPTWLQSVPTFVNWTRDSPHFDASGRYLSLASSPPYSLLDLSTSPPTDLSALVTGVEPNVILADRRAVIVHDDSGQLNCRIWDLDARRQIGNYPMYSLFAREPIRSPDDRFIVLQEPPSDSAFAKFIDRIREWLGRPAGSQSCYRVVDLETGQTVNRFVTADRPTQFDADLQSVWCHSCEWNPGHEVWLRFPLRGGAPPWWLWGATALGGLVLVRNGHAALRAFPRRSRLPTSV